MIKGLQLPTSVLLIILEQRHHDVHSRPAMNPEDCGNPISGMEVEVNTLKVLRLRDACFAVRSMTTNSNL